MLSGRIACPVLHRSPIWKYAAEYCPMHLVKTAELDPDQNYVMGFHPHGIISMSAFVTFATEALDVSKKYPGDACCPIPSCSSQHVQACRSSMSRV